MSTDPFAVVSQSSASSAAPLPISDPFAAVSQTQSAPALQSDPFATLNEKPTAQIPQGELVAPGYQTPGQRLVTALGNASAVVQAHPAEQSADDTNILSDALSGIKNLGYNTLIRPFPAVYHVGSDIVHGDTKQLQEGIRKNLFAALDPFADADKANQKVEQTGTNPVNTGKGLVDTAKNVATLPLAGQFHRKGAGPIEGETEDWLTGQINPLNIALIVATMGGTVAESALVKAGVSAPKAAALVKYAGLAANLGFLSKQGWDLGQNAIPAAETAWKDYKSAKTESEKAEALDKLKRRLTDITLDSLAAGLASHGLTSSIAEVHELSPNARAHANADYSTSVHDYQANKQIGSGQAEQFHREGIAEVKDAVQREAISNHIEANGDAQLLEQRARQAESNPETEQHAEGYDAAKHLSPEAQSLRDRITGVLDDWRNRLGQRGLITKGRENYIPHKWTFEDVDPATGATAATNNQTPRDFLKERTFNSFHEGEQAGFEPTTKDAAKLTADYVQKASGLLAKDDLAHSLLDGKTTAGTPLAVTTAQLTSPEFAKYQPIDLSVMKADGTLGRQQIAVHPDIAQDLNAVLSKPGASNIFLKLSQQAKGTLLSLSPFHAVMEGVLAGESGINPFGRAKESFFTRLPQNVDYFNLTPEQTQAIRDGLNTMPAHSNYLSEGETAGGKNLLINKLPLVGDLNNFMHERLFGSNGMITGLKFDLYGKLKPEIQARYPTLSEEQAGRLAASQVNNKFGGLNYELLGRDAGNQKVLRTLLLAPDFLESRGRSILDVAGQHGAPLAQRLLAFNVAHYLAARAINYLVSGETHPEAGFAVLSKDGKREYAIRTTMGDFLHFIEQPGSYLQNRINPVIRTAGELVTGRDLSTGQKVSNDQKFWDAVRQVTPIPAQALTPKQTISQPSAGDELLKSIGIASKKVFTPAETLAMQKQSFRNENGEPLTGDALSAAQKKHELQQNLSDAIQARDEKTQLAALKAITDATQGPSAVLTLKQAKELKDTARLFPTRIQAAIHRLPLADSLDVWDVSSQQEKKLIRKEIQKKIVGWHKTGRAAKLPRQWDEMLPRIIRFENGDQPAQPTNLPQEATHFYNPDTKQIHEIE